MLTKRKPSKPKTDRAPSPAHYTPRHPAVYYSLHHLCSRAIHARLGEKNRRVTAALMYMQALSDLWIKDGGLTLSDSREFFADFSEIERSLKNHAEKLKLDPLQVGLMGELANLVRVLDRIR